MSEDFLIPLAAISLPAIIVPTVMLFRHANKKREYEHRERMKALETGQPVPGEAAWPAAVATAAVGLGVPLVSYFFTFCATMSAPHLAAEVWIAPTITSFFGLFASVGIAKSMQRPSPRIPSDPYQHEKPMVHDPDAYDVVGSRG